MTDAMHPLTAAALHRRTQQLDEAEDDATARLYLMAESNGSPLTPCLDCGRPTDADEPLCWQCEMEPPHWVDAQIAMLRYALDGPDVWSAERRTVLENELAALREYRPAVLPSGALAAGEVTRRAQRQIRTLTAILDGPQLRAPQDRRRALAMAGRVAILHRLLGHRSHVDRSSWAILWRTQRGQARI